MAIKIISEEEEKVIKLENKSMSIEELLRKVGINPVTVIVKKNDKIVPVEEKANDGDVLELIPVVSGG